MDRALKERIIGAVVLVAFVVLVVPVFLDGPDTTPAVVTESVPLPGQEEQPIKTIILERDRTEPVPAPTTVAPAAEDAGEDPFVAREPPETDSAEPEPAPAAEETVVATESDAETADSPAEEPAPSPAAAEPEPQPAAASTRPTTPAVAEPRPEPARGGMWAVQLGSFSNEENANRLAADLRRQGFAAFLSRTQNGALHRVRVGPQKDRPDAEAMARRLADAGHRGQVVPHP